MEDHKPGVSYDYPACEHLDVLVTPGDWINDELRMAGADGKEARDNLYVDLRNLHQHAPYVKLLGGLANRISRRQMTRDARHRDVSRAQAIPLLGQSLYSGALLGVRAELMPERQEFRRWMLSRGGPRTGDLINGAYQRSVDGLKRLPGDTQSALWAAASKLFVDLPDAQAQRHQVDFLKGYSVVASTVDVARRFSTHF